MMKLSKNSCTATSLIPGNLRPGVAALCLLTATNVYANDQRGEWGPLIDWNLNPIHAILTPNNTLLTYGQGGGVEYSVWYIGMGTLPFSRTLIDNDTTTDLFCSSQILLPDTSTVMMTGGDQLGGGNPGNPNTTYFNDQDSSMTDAGVTMAYPRWYPTTTTLPNGEILSQGGRSHDDPNVPVLTPEIYNPATGWRTLDGATSEYAYGGFKWWYPRSWILPNGLAFGISGNSMFYVDYQNNGDTVSAGNFDKEHTYETSTAVMYRSGKILQLGGGIEGNVEGTPATDTASYIDVTGLRPVVTEAPNLNYARHWADTTILPDGNVLVTGGSQLNNHLGGRGPVQTPELLDVTNNEWQLMAAEDIPRLYHSFTILLPDATILTGGGGEPGPQINRNAQIFSPPYLFDGDELAERPVIEVTNKQLQYGGTVTVRNLSNGNTIDRVTLVKTGAVTHSFNNEQRFIELDLSNQSGQLLTAQLPDSPTIATPGYYLLFAIDANGTPSEAEFVHFSPDSTYVPPASPIEFCENVASPGAIYVHPNALVNGIPQAIHSEQDAFGGLDGSIEYQWVSSTLSEATRTENDWVAIPDATDKWHSPDNVAQTTYFARQAKRSECETSYTTNAIAVGASESGASEGVPFSSPTFNTPNTLSANDQATDQAFGGSVFQVQSAASSAGNCLFDHALANNEWGWDPVNRISCAPAVNTCDYQDAHLNDGWGWDPVTRQSCKPRVSE